MSAEMLQDPHFEEDDYRPWIFANTRVPHYYGDSTRELMLAAGALILLGAPFYAEQLASELPFIIIGTIIVTIAAAYTNPWSRIAVTADAIISGVGLALFETWSLAYFSLDQITFAFVLKEVIAGIFMYSLYLSLKTLRNMLNHQIGKHDTRFDFMSSRTYSELTDQEKLSVSREDHEKMKEHNEEEKEEYRD